MYFEYLVLYVILSSFIGVEHERLAEQGAVFTAEAYNTIQTDGTVD